MAELDRQELASQYGLWPYRKNKVDAVDDKGRTDEDTPVELDLLANDEGATDIWLLDGEKVQVGDEIVLNSGARVRLLEDGVVSYDPSSSAEFERLVDGETETDGFIYGASGRKGWDFAWVEMTIDGVGDPPSDNSPPVANDDFVSVPRPFPYPKPYPYPLPLAAETTSTVNAESLTIQPIDGPIYTTLAIGEEGDPDSLPKSVTIKPLANDYDPDGDPLSVGTINGEAVKPGDEVPLKSGAIVRLEKDGATLTYINGILDDRGWLLNEVAAGAYRTTTTGSLEELSLPTPLPEPILYPFLADFFKYQASDGDPDGDGADLSNEAYVTIATTGWYYDDFPIA